MYKCKSFINGAAFIAAVIRAGRPENIGRAWVMESPDFSFVTQYKYDVLHVLHYKDDVLVWCTTVHQLHILESTNNDWKYI